jgi:Leucine-rich repeat (LRR) protein
MSNIATLMKLKSITLNDTNITDTDLAHFSKLDRMEFIELYRCRKVGDAGVKAFGGLSSLIHLNLSDTKVGDTGLEHLSRLTKLEELSLANTAITDAGLVHLSAMRKMHLLVLDGTAVNGSGLGALTKMPNMSQLQLMNSQLTGENWMKFVPKMESYDRGLMFLSKGSKITPEEAQKIRKLSKGQAFIN